MCHSMNRHITSLAGATCLVWISTSSAHAQPVDDGGRAGPEGEPAATATAEPAAGYEKGFFITSSDGAFSMTANARVQGRYTYEGIDGGDDESNFSVARARLKLEGHAFADNIEYVFQTDLGKGNVTLKDFWIDYGASDSLVVRVGQYKRPFSRQQISSSGSLVLVDRSITDRAFGGGRDIGVMVHNHYEDSPEGLEWAAGVFNGSGDKASFSGEADPMTGEVSGSFSNVPDMFGPMFVVRAGWNSADIKGYKEADLEGGPLRYGAAASVLVELDGDDDDTSSIRGQADVIIKNNGLSANAAAFVATAQTDMDFVDQSYAAVGAHAQAGYMVTSKLQPAVRVGVVAADADTDADVIEAAGGISYYLHDHGFKWQTDVSLLRSTIADISTNDVLVRSQLQLAF